jgi:hypothetical protein
MHDNKEKEKAEKEAARQKKLDEMNDEERTTFLKMEEDEKEHQKQKDKSLKLLAKGKKNPLKRGKGKKKKSKKKQTTLQSAHLATSKAKEAPIHVNISLSTLMQNKQTLVSSTISSSRQIRGSSKGILPPANIESPLNPKEEISFKKYGHQLNLPPPPSHSPPVASSDGESTNNRSSSTLKLEQSVKPLKTKKINTLKSNNAFILPPPPGDLPLPPQPPLGDIPALPPPPGVPPPGKSMLGTPPAVAPQPDPPSSTTSAKKKISVSRHFPAYSGNASMLPPPPEDLPLPPPPGVPSPKKIMLGTPPPLAPPPAPPPSSTTNVKKTSVSRHFPAYSGNVSMLPPPPRELPLPPPPGELPLPPPPGELPLQPPPGSMQQSALTYLPAEMETVEDGIREDDDEVKPPKFIPPPPPPISALRKRISRIGRMSSVNMPPPPGSPPPPPPPPAGM